MYLKMIAFQDQFQYLKFEEQPKNESSLSLSILRTMAINADTYHLSIN